LIPGAKSSGCTDGAHLLPAGKDAMVSYRALLIDMADQVFAVHTLNCGTDADAMRLAAEIETPSHYVEVWHGPRRIGSVQPKNKMP
jgi:hypothetical protein